MWLQLTQLILAGRQSVLINLDKVVGIAEGTHVAELHTGERRDIPCTILYTKIDEIHVAESLATILSMSRKVL